MAGEAEGEGAGDGLGEGESPEASVGVGLGEAALRAEAVEVDRPALAAADLNGVHRLELDELRQVPEPALLAELVLYREALLPEPGVEIGGEGG